MVQSFFIKFLAAFIAITASIQERINGKKTENTYLFREMLTKKLSIDLRWDSLSVNTSIVAADVVSLSSSLPLKKRDSFKSASGEIPKLGMKMSLNEKQMSDIQVMKARGVAQSQIAAKIFDDAGKCTMGILEKLEYMFLQGLSDGITLVDDDTNVGTGIRVDYGYSNANKFGALTKWSDASAKPLDDIKRILQEAKKKGDIPKVMMLDDDTLQAFCDNAQVKGQYAFMLNFVGDNANIPSLDQEQAAKLILQRFKLELVVVDRQVMVERDGKQTAVKPWADNIVIFLNSKNVGDLAYGVLVEDTNRNSKVMYAKIEDYILLKKWATEEPFEEFTSSQALVLPVINNVDSIYRLDVEEAATDTQTEGDANFDYEETAYTKASVIDAINLAYESDDKAKATHTDVWLLRLINQMSDEQIEVFEANIVAV